MYERSRRRQLTVLAVLVAAAIVCITVDFRQPQGGPVDRLQRVAVAAFGPLQRGASAVVRPVADRLNDRAGSPLERPEHGDGQALQAVDGTAVGLAEVDRDEHDRGGQEHGQDGARAAGTSRHLLREAPGLPTSMVSVGL